jgi:uncharacterized protein YoxC
LISTLVFMTGCYSIPKNSSLVGEVDGAIVVLQEENDKLIKALGDVQRAILDDKFERIYADVESKYREKNNIPTETSLTSEQNLDVTANVIAVRDLILAEISEKEKKLYEQSHANFNKLRTINAAVKEYLDSVQSLKEARSEATKKLSEISGIDFNEINKFTESLKKPMELIENLQNK